MAALPPWFDSDTAPVRDGFYDVRTGAGHEQRAYFGEQGKRRGWWTAVPAADASAAAVADVLEWRGLAAPAEG